MLIEVGSGYHKLVFEHSGKALDNGNKEADGDVMIQWADKNTVTQRWRLIRV